MNLSRRVFAPRRDVRQTREELTRLAAALKQDRQTKDAAMMLYAMARKLAEAEHRLMALEADLSHVPAKKRQLGCLKAAH